MRVSKQTQKKLFNWTYLFFVFKVTASPFACLLHSNRPSEANHLLSTWAPHFLFLLLLSTQNQANKKKMFLFVPRENSDRISFCDLDQFNGPWDLFTVGSYVERFSFLFLKPQNYSFMLATKEKRKCMQRTLAADRKSRWVAPTLQCRIQEQFPRFFVWLDAHTHTHTFSPFYFPLF